MRKILLSVLALGLFTTSFAQVPQMIVLEEFTNASCSPCASQNPAYNTLLQANLSKVVSIKYQWYFPGFDPMNAQNPTEPDSRIGFYGISGVPTLAMNGRVPDNNNTTGGNWTSYAGGPYGLTQAVIDNESALMTPLDIEISHVFNTSLDSISVHVKVANVSNTVFTSSAKLLLAMTEQQITFSSAPGSNGEKEFFEVMRKMYPDVNGTSLPGSINAGDSAIFDFNVKIPTYIYDLSQIAFVTFVQDLSSKQMYQGALSVPVSVSGPDAGITDNTPTPSDYCATSISPTVEITNAGTVVITSADVTVNLNGTPTVQNWSGNLAPGATETVTFSSISLIDGTNEWFTTIGNVNGGGDVSGSNNTSPSVFVIKLPGTAVTPVLTEDFEASGNGGAPTVMIEDNPNDERMFTVTKAIGGLPNAIGGFANSETSLRFDYPTIDPGNGASVMFEKIDLSNQSYGKLTFSHAHALQDGTESDQLEVLISTDCGANWTSVWNKVGSDLTTRANVSGARFYPQLASDWTADTIYLNDFDGESEVLIRFNGTSGAGNCLYIDDIMVTGSPLSVKELFNSNDISMYPNPTSNNVTLALTSVESKNVSIRVFDLSGRTVLLIPNQSLISGNNTVKLNTESLNNGVYFVEVSSKSQSSTLKLVIQK